MKTQTRKFVSDFCEFCAEFEKESDQSEQSLLIGRCCYAMAELCSELQQCLADEWQESRDELISQGDKCVTNWMDRLAIQCGKIYLESFPPMPNEQILTILPVLTNQTVKEENESGETIESQISGKTSRYRELIRLQVTSNDR